MKTIKILAAVAILCGVSAVSFYSGRKYEEYYYNYDNLFEVHQKLRVENEKCYKAACLFSDAIRLEYDNLDESEKNCTFTAYSSLEEACCEEGLDTDSLLREYVWCY